VVEREFKVQVMETAAQWKSGLSSRLDFDSNGLSLFLNPVFDSWLVKNTSTFAGGDIVVDECNQVYWTILENGEWVLFRHNPLTSQIERVLNFGKCEPVEPRELWFSRDLLWIFDHVASEARGQILGLSRDNWQIIHELTIDNVVDVDFDQKDTFWAISKTDDGTKVCALVATPNGGASSIRFELTTSKEQSAIAVLSDRQLYLLDSTQGRLILVNPQTKQETVLAAPQERLLKGLKPTAMQIDRRGVLFIATSEPAHLYMFDKDGSFLGEAEMPPNVTRIDGLGFNTAGGVLVATDQGLARLSLSKNSIGQEGVFYSKVLDNGEPESLWHRISLRGSIPTKASVEVYYFTSDNQTLKDIYDKTLSGTDSTEQKVAQIETLLGTNWIGPEQFQGSSQPTQSVKKPGEADPPKSDALELIINPNKGRYLWLKIRLITFDQKVRPTVQSARVYYPRLTYLRYLPPVYREDPVSAAFLERFLSMFETSFGSLESEIDYLFRHFDPKLAPKEFLPWLSSWINLSLDDDVPEDRVRRFIQRASYLYSRKGTPQALVEFLRLYTGRRVFLREHMTGIRPLVIGDKDSTLGSGIVLLGSGPRGMTVGNTSIVGYSAIRDRVNDPAEPFIQLARRFSVLIDMDRAEFDRRKPTLQRIITEQAPAHTSFTLSITANQSGLGKAVLGVSARVEGSQEYRVGLSQLGRASALAREPRALRIERGAWVGSTNRV
jgi:phage tail-like protein